MGYSLWGDEQSRGGRVVGWLAEWIALVAGAKVVMGRAGLITRRARLCGVKLGDVPAKEVIGAVMWEHASGTSRARCPQVLDVFPLRPTR